MKKVWFLALFPTFLYAQSPDECVKIDDNTARLACYDALFAKNKAEQNSEQSTEKKHWSYEVQKDEMRGTSNYFAYNISLNEAQLGFPYNGGSKVTLMLRKHSEYGNDIILSVDRGQFTCRLDSCQAAIKFDDNKVEKISLVESSSGSNDTLFIPSSKGVKHFMAKLKQAKKVIIELSFFDHGKEQFTFDVEGLEWTHF